MANVDDRDVIEAFTSGARKAFGPELHIEGDALFLAGWWQAAFRVAPGVVLLRNEEAPDDSPVLVSIAEALASYGLTEVGVDLPAMTPIIYTELTLGAASWTLWAADLPSGESALATRAMADSFVGGPTADPMAPSDLGAELGGARRLAGEAPSLILTVGLKADVVTQLDASMTECRFISRTFGEIVPDRCGTLIPTLIMVDADEGAGRDFILGLRNDVYCRFLPVVAVTAGPSVPPGADISLDPAEPPAAWAGALRRILP